MWNVASGRAGAPSGRAGLPSMVGVPPPGSPRRCVAHRRRGGPVSERARLAAELERALDLDEVGIASARFDGYRLKTSHQPIFRRDEDVLTPFGVEARLVAGAGRGQAGTGRVLRHAAGRASQLRRGALPPAECEERRNMSAFSSPRLRHLSDHRPEARGRRRRIAEVASLSRACSTLRASTRRLICEILDAGGRDSTSLIALADGLRGAGIRFAIAEFRVGQPKSIASPPSLPTSSRSTETGSVPCPTPPTRQSCCRRWCPPSPPSVRPLFVQGIETPGRAGGSTSRRCRLRAGHRSGAPSLAGSCSTPTRARSKRCLRRSARWSLRPLPSATLIHRQRKSLEMPRGAG